jgi:hypothetical protein
MATGMVTATAYLSNNQAFVSAQISLDIDFGTVFPGTVANSSFTITSEVPYGYIITMTAPADPLVSDLRPYLMLVRDPSEQDLHPDGPVSGAPDYKGSGSFENMEDLSDKWLATFFVPGSTGDYDCKITIEPIPGG